MKIVKRHPTPADRGTRPGAVILVNRGGCYEPFVTAWLGDGDSSWCWGHYFHSLEDALEDYAKRTKRGF